MDNEYSQRFSDALVSEIKAEMGRRDLSSRRLGTMIGESSQYMSMRLDGGNPRTGERVTLNVRDLYAIASALGIEATSLIPVPTKIPVSEALTAVDLAIAQVSSDLAIPYVSPIQEGWVDESNVEWFINEETKHPDSPGHAQLAEWLIAEFTARSTQ